LLSIRWITTWLYILGGAFLILLDTPVWIWAFLSAHFILLFLSIDMNDFRLKLQYTFLVVVDFFVIVHLFILR